MSQATDLLNTLSNEGFVDPSAEAHIVVGNDRFIYVPDDLKKIGVAGDKDINTVTFDCPRYWDGVDISEFTMYINYMRPNNSASKYHATVTIDAEDENILHFDWTFSDHALEYKGTLTFLLCAKEIDENGIETRHWNSERNSDLVISEGMEVDEAIVSQHPDVITHILKDIAYLKENGTGGPGTSGEDGGYYSLFLEQNEAGTLTVNYTASKPDMPAIEPKTFTLPVGPKGDDGKNGADGGHYTPSVKDNGNGTMTVSFAASKEGMHDVAPITIVLPVPADGEDGQNGQDGKDGEDGGYYTPSIHTLADNTFKISFTASKSGMPSIGDVTIALPTAKDGEDGTNGTDGVGIESVVQTTTSTADGGENIITVTLTNGNKSTFNIKNGSKGSTGEAGTDGKDGTNGTDGKDGVGIKSIAKTSTSGLVDTYTVTLTNNTTSTFTVTNGKAGTNGTNGTSVTVASVTESTESGGENVVEFSDGNRLTVRNGLDGADNEQVEDIVLVENAYDEGTAKFNVRLGTGTAEVNLNGSLLLDYTKIAYDPDAYVLISGIPALEPRWDSYFTINYYDANKNPIAIDEDNQATHTQFGFNNKQPAWYFGEVPCSLNLFSPLVDDTTPLENVEYVRIRLGLPIKAGNTGISAEDCAGLVVRIAKKRNISQDVPGIPSHWSDEVSVKTDAVKALQEAGGKNCVTFAWAADLHIPNNAMGRTEYLGRVMGKMLDNCEAPFAIISGDMGTRGSMPTEDEYMEVIQQAHRHLAPLWGSDRLLMALGNHDGVFGDATQGKNLSDRLSQEKMWNTFFRGQALDFRRVFSDNGLYYYVDNIPQKTRFIVLNSHFAADLSDRNVYETSCYGQAQLNWFSDVALDMPSGYGAVIITHVAPRKVNAQSIYYTVDYYQLNGIINAYINKTAYSGSYSGTDGWTSSDISVDFSGAKGEIIAMFTGHEHRDILDTETLDCPILTIVAAGAGANEGHKTYNRPFGTGKETSFDVVTINRTTNKIHCTRVGAGSDRVVSYGGAEIKTYTVTWDVDGVTTKETYNEGDRPSFKGSTDKASDGQYTYTFTDWSPAIALVTGDVTYTAQYSKTEIYTITNNLVNCTNSNSDTTEVTEGSAYNATITANSGYTLDSVSVTMGVDSVSAEGGVISIASVTGNIVITASASKTSTEPSYTNLAEPNDTNTTDKTIWINNARLGSNGTVRDNSNSNSQVTNPILVNRGEKIYFAGTDMSSDGNSVSTGGQQIAIYLSEISTGAETSVYGGTPAGLEGSYNITFTYHDDGTLATMVNNQLDTSVPGYMRLVLSSALDKSKIIISKEPIE